MEPNVGLIDGQMGKDLKYHNGMNTIDLGNIDPCVLFGLVIDSDDLSDGHFEVIAHNPHRKS